MNRPFARALLASAAIAAAVALAGCDADSISPTGRAQAEVESTPRVGDVEREPAAAERRVGEADVDPERGHRLSPRP